MTPLEHALRYLGLKWPLFRVWGASGGRCRCESAPDGFPTKKDHTGGKGSPGKHPLQGQGEATLDESTVRSWFDAPYAPGIAMACGPESGVWVLDVDPRSGGHETLARLVAEHGPLPETPAVRTGGGGLHLFFAWPAHGRPPRRKLGPGLDVITSDAPYLILPPSTHVAGGTYEWIRPPWDLPTASGVAPAAIEP